VVLGAGRSTRLGRPKQTLPFGDTTLLGWTVRDVEASSLDRVVVVVGGAAEEAKAGLASRDSSAPRAELVSNDAYASGCASSLLAGLEAVTTESEAVTARPEAVAARPEPAGPLRPEPAGPLRPEPAGPLQRRRQRSGSCAAVMLLLGDMPGVNAQVIDAVRMDWEQHRSWISVTSYRGQLGHPFVFSAEAFSTLRGLHGDKAVWKVIQVEPDRVRRVPIDRPLPIDVDTWEDYAAAGAALGVGVVVRPA